MNVSGLGVSYKGHSSPVIEKILKKSGISNSNISQVGKKNSSPLSEEVVNKIKTLAKEGAEKGIYMGERYHNFYRQCVETANLRPDFSHLKANISSLLNRTPYSQNNLFGQIFGYSVEMGVGLTNDFARVCDQNGNDILWYDSRRGWVQFPTKEEEEFERATTAIYAEAYSLARSEMREKGLLEDKATSFRKRRLDIST